MQVKFPITLLAVIVLVGSLPLAMGAIVIHDQGDGNWSGTVRIECCPELVGTNATSAHLRIPGPGVMEVLFDGDFSLVDGVLVLELDTTALPDGTFTAAFEIQGEDGVTYSDNLAITIANHGPSTPLRIPATWWITGLLFTGAVIATLLAVALRHRRRPAPEDVFLMAQGGLLVRHLGPDQGLVGRQGRSLRQGDEDLVSSMLVAIQNFVEVSFEAKGETAELTQIAFGRRTILMESSDRAILALVVPGEPRSLDLDFFKRHMLSVLTRIEERYGDELEGWSGDEESMPALSTILAGVFRY